MTNKLVMNASVYVFGNFIQRAFEFLLIPLWTKFLTPDDYGITGSMTAYATVLYTILLLGIPGSVARHYYDYLKDKFKQKEYVTSVAVFQLLFGLAVTIVLDRGGEWAWNALHLNSIPFNPFVRLMLWSTYLRTFTQIPLILFQVQQKPKQFLAVQYGTFIVNLITALVLVVGMNRGAAGQLLSLLVAAAVVGSVCLVLLVKNWFVKAFDWKYVREGLAFGLPLVPHALSAWALNAADRVILQWYVPLREIGFYSLGYNIGMVMSVLVISINQAWSPYYYRMMDGENRPDTKIVSTVSAYVALIGGLCLFGILFSGEAIYLMLPKKYYDALPYVSPVLLGYLFLGFYYFASSPLFYFKKTHYIPLISGLSAILNIGLNIWLIPIYGPISSAWITTFTYAVLMLVSLVLGRRFYPLRYPLWKYAVVIGFLLASIFVAASLPILNGGAIVLKAGIFLGYSGLVALLLLRPFLKTGLKQLLQQS